MNVILLKYETTEAESYYSNLEQMSVLELLSNINKEDNTIPAVVEKCIPQIESLINAVVNKLKMAVVYFILAQAQAVV